MAALKWWFAVLDQPWRNRLISVSGTLADPWVTLLDSNGNVVQTNDNWKNTDQAAISAAGKAPPNDLRRQSSHQWQPETTPLS